MDLYCIRTVSYTHLLEIEQAGLKACPDSLHKDSIIISRFSIRAVSYTHLDVYKRQIDGGPAYSDWHKNIQHSNPT